MKFNYLEFSSPFFFVISPTKKFLYTQKKNSTISNTTINIHLATTVVELLMEIKFSYTFFDVREKQQKKKMNKSKTRNKEGTEKNDGKNCMDVAQRRFLCVFF